MRTEGQGNDGQGNETTRAGTLVGRCGLPGPSFLGSTFATPAARPAPHPNAHGLPVGSLRSPLRQRGNRTPSPPGSGGAAAARRREKEGEAAGCSDKREAPTGKPWASRPCQPTARRWDCYARRSPPRCVNPSAFP